MKLKIKFTSISTRNKKREAMRLIITILIVLLFIPSAYGSELNFKFHSPSFSGQGKSSHYLTIENIEKTRKDAIKAAVKHKVTCV
jgi:hypothetical protein